jgi:hypothetical protein
MKENEKSSGRPKFWLWILVIIFMGLLAVPFMAMGVALKKVGLVAFMNHPLASLRNSVPATPTGADVPPEHPEMTGLRAKLEKAAARVIQLPKLNSKLKQVQIETPSASLNEAHDEMQQLLYGRNVQFVEAVEADRIRIVIIIPSKEWPELAASMQAAATKDGFVYRGPSQTETAGNQADSMVAQIEILKMMKEKMKD